MKPLTQFGIILLLALLVLLSTGVYAQDTNSPEGYSYIAFVMDNLYVMDIQTMEVSILGAFSPSGGDPLWSPDSKRIAFSSSVFGNQDPSNVYILDIDGSRFLEIPSSSLPPVCERARYGWMPDGDHIAFDCPQTGDWYTAETYTIVLVSTDGQAEIEIIPFDVSARCDWFDISLDGQRLVCGGTNRNYFTHSITVFDMQNGDTLLEYQRGPESSDRIRGTVEGIYVLDNERILIWYMFPSRFEIINFEGEPLYLSPEGLIEQLPLTEVQKVSPSPDGGQIVFSAANTKLAIIDLASETVEVIYENEVGAAVPDWSPLLEEPLDLPDEPYTIEYLCALLEESGGHCGLDSTSDKD